jgi:type 1 glutamine amidotransferase
MVTLVILAVLAIEGPSEDALFPRELAPGVFVLGSSQKFNAENLGWVVLEDRVILVGVPDPQRIPRLLEQIAQTSSKPIGAAIVLQARSVDLESASAFARRGIDIVIQKDGATVLRAAFERVPADVATSARNHIREFADRVELGNGQHKIEVIDVGRFAGPGVAVAYLSQPRILFVGALCVHGPRAELAGTDTLGWLSALSKLQGLPCRTVVPGRGSVGDASLLEREQRFLRELRRQVGHLVAQSRSLEDIVKEVKITSDYLVWMPYDHPTREDVEHVYRELTVPLAPFGIRDTLAVDSRPKALVLIGDSPHDPGHIEAGLRRALGGAGIVPYIAVDVRTLSAENLRQVQLLVMLRDGVIWPDGRDKAAVSWMTMEQQQAVVNFVEGGGGLLALHNSTALYPENGPFLKLIGGTYMGHGPLERFRVSVRDRSHPITQGVNDFEVADEQHTPTTDRTRVHLLLESRSSEGTMGVAGWVHQVGRGRVCYLANGHTREAQNHPEFQKLLQNAALWCLGGEQGQKQKR